MMDSYQPIYDAVRSRIGQASIDDAVRQAIRDLDLGFQVELARDLFREVAGTMQQPSAIYRPRIYIDGDQWCALYGDNVQDGVAGFGASPAEAVADFNANWQRKLEKRQEPEPRGFKVGDRVRFREGEHYGLGTIVKIRNESIIPDGAVVADFTVGRIEGPSEDFYLDPAP